MVACSRRLYGRRKARIYPIARFTQRRLPQHMLEIKLAMHWWGQGEKSGPKQSPQHYNADLPNCHMESAFPSGVRVIGALVAFGCGPSRCKRRVTSHPTYCQFRMTWIGRQVPRRRPLRSGSVCTCLLHQRQAEHQPFLIHDLGQRSCPKRSAILFTPIGVQAPPRAVSTC